MPFCAYKAVIGLFLLFFVVAGCATPTYQAKRPGEKVVTPIRIQFQKEAIAQKLDRRERLLHLTWPLMSHNADLCRKVRPDLGMVIADLAVIERYLSKLTRAQIAHAGYDERAHVLYVMPNSPASHVGLREGDWFVAVGTEALDMSLSAEKIMRVIKKHLNEDGKVTLSVQSGDEGPRTVHLEAKDVCDVKVLLSSSDAINAFAAKDNIVMHEGMLRLLDDAGVQFIMAHELAHQAGRHQRKWIYNAIVSGGIIYGPLLVAGGEIIDVARKALGQKPKISLASKAISNIGLGSEIFEAEADYLGLYMLARAGGDLSGAEETFAFFAREKPSSTWIRYTHPLTPERIAAVRMARTEIEAKRDKGMALMPEK